MQNSQRMRSVGCNRIAAMIQKNSFRLIDEVIENGALNQVQEGDASKDGVTQVTIMLFMLFNIPFIVVPIC